MSKRIFRKTEQERFRAEAGKSTWAEAFSFPAFSIPGDSAAYDLAAKAASIKREGFRPFDGNPLRTVEEEARARAEILVASAEADARKVTEEAYREGFARGEAEGREAGREAFLRVSAAFREGLEQLNRLREDILRENEEHLAAVAVAVAERVIHREVQTDPGVVRSVVRAALAAAAELDEVTVALHADDVELIREEAEDLVAAFDHLRNLHLAAEPGIERGGCIVRTPCGDVEARIPMQFDAIVEALRSALPNFTEPG